LEVQLGSYYERHGKRYHDIQQRSKLLTDHMQANKDTDRNHIDYVIPVDSERQKEYIRGRLILATMKYKEALKLLLLHRDLSDDEIEDFQDLIDDFFEIWVGIFGDEGITNYTHMLGAGHIYYFLKKYKCLYLYSQQGWEALNGKIQTFIHQSSQQGGHHSGTRAGEKSYIYSVVRFPIRDLLWKTYEADLFFLNLETKGIVSISNTISAASRSCTGPHLTIWVNSSTSSTSYNTAL